MLGQSDHARARAGDGRAATAATSPGTSNETAPTSVAKASLGNGLLYAYTKPAARRT